MTTQLYMPKEEAIILEKLLAKSIGVKQSELRQNIRKGCSPFFKKHLYEFLFAPVQDEEQMADLKMEILSLWTKNQEELESALSGLSFVIESREIITPKELQQHMENTRRRSENLLGGTEASFLVIS